MDMMKPRYVSLLSEDPSREFLFKIDNEVRGKSCECLQYGNPKSHKLNLIKINWICISFYLLNVKRGTSPYKRSCDGK